MFARENIFRMGIDTKDLELLNQNFRKLFDWLREIDERLEMIETKKGECVEPRN